VSDPVFDPYAPPKADLDGPSKRPRGKKRRRDLRTALRRLNEHVADPSALAADARAAGGRIRVATVIIGVLFVASLGLLLFAIGDTKGDALLVLAVMASVILGLLAVVMLVLDLSLVARDRPGEPEKTLRTYLKALPIRPAYAWAMLCPTAREQAVQAPELDELPTGAGTFSMSSPDGVKQYAGTFARQGGGQMHQLALKSVIVRESDDEVAVLQVHAEFTAWPAWVSFVGVAGFILFRPLVLIGIILYFVMRKRTQRTFDKTMLRAQNGVWYVFDADLLEGSESD